MKGDSTAQDLIDQLVGAAHGDLFTVQAILTEHPHLVNEPARWGETAIQAAAQMGRADIIYYLLDHGAPLDICTATMVGQAKVVGHMLATNRETIRATGAHGIPLLYFAVIKGHTGLAIMLQEVGASPNAAQGVTSPLHGAALFDQPEMARWLLRIGASPEARDDQGHTPLEVAEARGHEGVVEVLKGAGT